ncbi:hypothetical protein CEXT_481941 [Caerostris extrusa]|uniref:Uncharacterized protein n=1 Tax=Caerostris extrusa TaxID=172846 RepID=A0AAV4UFP1_CAEEX|nr:hypothetical protein CEXT_481941 [Caerostris extrusa]
MRPISMKQIFIFYQHRYLPELFNDLPSPSPSGIVVFRCSSVFRANKAVCDAFLPFNRERYALRQTSKERKRRRNIASSSSRGKSKCLRRIMTWIFVMDECSL